MYIVGGIEQGITELEAILLSPNLTGASVRHKEWRQFGHSEIKLLFPKLSWQASCTMRIWASSHMLSPPKYCPISINSAVTRNGACQIAEM